MEGVECWFFNFNFFFVIESLVDPTMFIYELSLKKREKERDHQKSYWNFSLFLFDDQYPIGRATLLEIMSCYLRFIGNYRKSLGRLLFKKKNFNWSIWGYVHIFMCGLVVFYFKHSINHYICRFFWLLLMVSDHQHPKWIPLKPPVEGPSGYLCGVISRRKLRRMVIKCERNSHYNPELKKKEYVVR